MEILVCTAVAIICWIIPGPIAFEWIQVSGRRLTLRPRLSLWVGHMGYRWRRLKSWLRSKKGAPSPRSIFLTTAHDCPGECGCVIGSGYLMTGDYWFHDLVTPRMCMGCARQNVRRLLIAMAEGRVRITRRLRVGDLLRLNIELDCNRIFGKRGQIAVIVDDGDEAREQESQQTSAGSRRRNA